MIATLNLAAAHNRIGRFALIAAALVIGIVALGAPAAEAAGASQTAAGASENGIFTALILLFGLIFAASAAAGAVAGAVM